MAPAGAGRRTEPADDPGLGEALRALAPMPPEQFVASRDALVRELRSRDARGLAARVAKLRRPSLALWVANQLHEVATEPLHHLLEIGAALRDQQSRAVAGDRAAARGLAALTARERETTRLLVERAAQLLRSSGRPAAEPTLRELETTLHAAAVADDPVRDQLAGGWLQERPANPGFGLVLDAGAPGFPTTAEGSATSTTAVAPTAVPIEEDPGRERGDRREDRRRGAAPRGGRTGRERDAERTDRPAEAGSAARHDAEAALRQARRQVDEARRAAAAARAQARRLEERADQLARAAARAEEAARVARDAADTAGARADAGERAAVEADETAERAAAAAERAQAALEALR